MANYIKELISIRSVSGDEKDIFDYIHKIVTRYDFPVYYMDHHITVHIKGRNSHKALILNGHVDTVSEGDINHWKYKPYSAERVKDRVYGLGSSDMKGGVAGMLSLVDYYSNNIPECDIWFTFVAGEELDGIGTTGFISWWYQQGLEKKYNTVECVISEPTNNEFVGIGHRGNYFIQISAAGESGHSSLPDRIKNNVINSVSQLCRDLPVLEESLSDMYSHPKLGSPSLGLTMLKTGSIETINRVPSIATISLDIRTTPQMHHKVESIIEDFLKNYPHKTEINIVHSSPTGWCVEGSEIRNIFSNNYKSISEKVMSGSTDQCFYSEIGIPCVIFGPGQRERMHSTDEFIEIDKIDEWIKILKEVVVEYGQISE